MRSVEERPSPPPMASAKKMSTRPIGATNGHSDPAGQVHARRHRASRQWPRARVTRYGAALRCHAQASIMTKSSMRPSSSSGMYWISVAQSGVTTWLTVERVQHLGPGVVPPASGLRPCRPHSVA